MQESGVQFFKNSKPVMGSDFAQKISDDDGDEENGDSDDGFDGAADMSDSVYCYQ